MIYVALQSAELQLSRIRTRVSEGGHAVPDDKVRSRRQRSFEQLAWFERHVDECFIYDNSVGEPDLVGWKTTEGLVHWGRLPKDMTMILEAGGALLVDGRAS
jgi:predicted ABC-type ATPase